MALDKCHYAVLGVVRTASEADIRKAYKKKALQLHPDKNRSPNAEAEFKQLHKSYSVLNDAKQKRVYDEKKATPAPPPRRASGTNQDSGRAGSGRSTGSQQRYTDRYAHMAPDYNHESTRDFINKIMREDRDVKNHKQDMSFQSWYRQKQGDWRKSEQEEEKREEQRKHKEDMERWAAEDRASRLRDIQQELERKKQEEQSRKAREAAQEAERAKAFEEKRKQAMEEIEEEEQRFKAKFKALDRKWMGTKVAADRPKEPQAPPEVKGARQSALRFTEDGELDDNSLEEALEEVRRQRESLKQEQQDRRREAADAWREVAAVRAGNYDFDSKRKSGGPPAPVRSAKEELAAARAALDAAISGDDSLAANFTPSSASCRSSRIDPLTKHLPRPKSPDEDNDSPRINLEISTPEGSPCVTRTRPEGPDESLIGEDLNAAFIGDG